MKFRILSIKEEEISCKQVVGTPNQCPECKKKWVRNYTYPSYNSVPVLHVFIGFCPLKIYCIKKQVTIAINDCDLRDYFNGKE